MAFVTKKLEEFPGFGIYYDPNVKPFFKSNLLEDLRQLASKPLGRDLLNRIANAKPKKRSVSSTLLKELQAIKFPSRVNVMCMPTSMDFVQSGNKKDIAVVSGQVVPVLLKSTKDPHNPANCRFYGSGGSFAEAADPAFSGSNKGGTVSIMHYTNAQTFSQGSGEREHTWPFIVLAHELIHSLHHLLGSRNEQGEEEDWTTGIGKFLDEPLSENKMRDAFGLPRRKGY